MEAGCVAWNDASRFSRQKNTSSESIIDIFVWLFAQRGRVSRVCRELRRDRVGYRYR